MMLSNLNLSSLPECNFEVRYVDSVLLNPCAEYQRFLSGILHGMARFLALYQGEYSRERLILRLRTVHPKTITRLAQNDTGNVADRHMKQILSIYNGAGRAHSLPCKR